MDRNPNQTEQNKTPNVVVFAYACEPEKGSEPGAGWGLVEAISRFADCTVLVAPEHAASIARHEAQHRVAGRRFVTVGEPRWARFAKWHRIPWFLAYLGWLRRAHKRALALHQQRAFDVAHHATYSVYWLPSPVTQLGIPSVWGPVGGAVRTPMRLWRLLGWVGVLGELLDWVAVRVASWLPATRRTWRRATVTLVQNDEAAQKLPSELAARSIILNHTEFTPAPCLGSRTQAGYVLWASSLEARKGPRLAVTALANTPADVRLIMIGEGPERRAVERLAERLGVADRLELRGLVPRSEVFDLMRGAAALLATGLREEGGVALAEAMMLGTPIIVLANGGAKTLAKRAVDPDRVRLIEPAGASETAVRIGRAMTQLVRRPGALGGPLIDQEAAHDTLIAAFGQALQRPIKTGDVGPAT